MNIGVMDGKEKVYLRTSSPRTDDLIKAYELAKSKGYKKYFVSILPGAMCCITFDPDFGDQDIGQDIDSIPPNVQKTINCLKESLPEIQENINRYSSFIFRTRWGNGT